MKRLGLLLIIMLLILAACGQEKEASVESSNSSPRRADAEQNTNQSADTTPAMDLWANVTDDLAFVQGQALYVQRAAQAEPQQIAAAIFPPTLALTPDTQFIVYNAIVSVRSRYLTVANVETLETRQVYRSTGDFSFFGGVSSDGQWATIFNFPSMYVVSIDGLTTHRIASIQNFGVTPFWLEDNTLLVVIQQNGVTQEVRRFDPVTGEDISITDQAATNIGEAALPIGTGIAAFMTFQGVISQELGVNLQGAIDPNAEDLEPAINLVGPPVNTQGTPELCGTWQITREDPMSSAEPDELLSIRDTVFLTNNLTLEDGSLVFVRWYFEDCNSSMMQAALMKLSPDGETTVLTDAIDPGTSPNLGFFFADTGPRVTYTSDGRYAVWIGGGLDEGESSINITELATGATSRLHYVVRDSSNATNFHTDTAYTGVLLVPRS